MSVYKMDGQHYTHSGSNRHLRKTIAPISQQTTQLKRSRLQAPADIQPQC
jgi:hypothetical protein